MAIIRTRLDFETEFTRIPNNWTRDGTISLRARGLLTLLMSHEPGWRVSKASLVAQNPEGREAIEAALRELRSAGYLTVAPSRDEKTGRMHGQDYMLSMPLINRVTGFPYDGEPAAKKTIYQEDHKKEKVKLNLPIERPRSHRGNASTAQVRFLMDAHILVHEELPTDDELDEYVAMSSVEADEEIKSLWPEVEHGGDPLLREILDGPLWDQLSPSAQAWIDRRLDI